MGKEGVQMSWFTEKILDWYEKQISQDYKEGYKDGFAHGIKASRDTLKNLDEISSATLKKALEKKKEKP